jgi:hypothetical protein
MAAETGQGRRHVAMPASTASPLVLAVGVTLLLAGLVTNPSVSIVGALLFVAGVVGWFREVLPHEHHVASVLEAAPPAIPASTRPVARLANNAPHRARLPVAIYPYMAGVRGGIAGGVAMAVVALLHGVLNHESPWYTVNLLAAAVQLGDATPAALATFSLQSFVIALLLHAALSLLVGLLYGVLLPMVPGHPAIWGGLVAPILWSGLVAAALPVLNPALDTYIAWPWFIASQIAFGAVAGFVVARSGLIPTAQHASFAERAGLETQDR